MKKLISAVLIFVIIATGVPIQVFAEYTTPKDIYIEDALERIDLLANTLTNKFFTVSQETCGYGLSGHGCDNCRMDYICESGWLEEMGLMVPDSMSCVTSQYYPNERKGNPNGWSCYGFANYAHWFIFSQKSSDYLTATLVGIGTLTYASLKALGACPGDVIRTKYSGSSATSGHSFVLIDYDESGMTILDCNSYPSAPDRANCYVLKRRMKYDGKEIAITGVANYKRTSEHTHSYNVVDKCTSCADVINYSANASKYSYDTNAASDLVESNEKALYKIEKNAVIRVSPYTESTDGSHSYSSEGFTVLASLKNSQGSPWYEILYKGNKMYISADDIYTEQMPSELTISPSATSYTIEKGSICSVKGSITSNYNITRVIGSLDGEIYSDFVPDSTSVNIGSTAENQLNSFKGALLSVGTHYLVITATDASGKTETVTLTIDVTGEVGETYTVSYDVNGGYGTPSEQTKNSDSDLTLSSSVPTRTGYDFLGWAEEPTATTAQYQSGGTYSANADVTLYAVWSLQSYNNDIKFWLTGFEDGTAVYLGKTQFTKSYKEEFLLSAEDCTIAVPSGFALRDTWACSFGSGWKNYTLEVDTVSQPAYEINAEYYFDPVNYSITYELDGGTNSSENPLTYNVITGVKSFSSPVKAGYKFLGWYDADGNEISGVNIDALEWRSTEELLYLLSTRTTGDITVYAKWELVYANILNVSYRVENDEVIFDVTTTPDFNRVKVMLADNLSSYITYTNNYTVTSNGNYVFSISVPAVEGATSYAFDARRTDTSKYTKNYYYATAEVEKIEESATIVSVTHTVSDGKIIFTVITKSGDFSRIKVTTDSALSGSLGVANSYTVNADGNYVWTIKAVAPTETTNYAFDLRNATTGKYLKEYFYYEVEEATPTIISASHMFSGEKIIFTVVTKSGNFNRIKVTTDSALSGSLGVAVVYTVNEEGNYVWTVKATASTETTNYAFDLRSSETGKYLKEYFYYNV